MLYIVATPIGNLEEITHRAISVLTQADLICAEDTRHTRLLLNKYSIKTPLKSYQKFNERASCDEIISRLKEGQNIALVSDAGMPLVSDPGAVLVEECIKANVEFTVVSGATAAINALVLSGLDSRAFTVCGFLPESGSARKKYLDRFANAQSTLILYSSVHNVDKDLADFHTAYGCRKVAVVREITKIYESVVRGTLGEPLEFIHKGEFVIVIEGLTNEYSDLQKLSAQEHLDMYLAAGMDKMSAIKRVAKERGVSKSEIYDLTIPKGTDDNK